MNRTKSQQRQPLPSRTCLFCDAAGPLTAEHIYGDWLHKLGFTGTGVREITGGGMQPIIQKGGPFSKKLKIVCASCNNGWMSRLEDDAKPLLVTLFNANGASVELDDEAQLLLARWAFKTAAVASQVTRTDPFPAAHRREFYLEARPPRRAQVRIATATIPTKSHGHQLAQYAFQPRRATVRAGRDTLSFPFYRATFRLLTVVFDVIGYVSEDVELEIDPSADLARAMLPIWAGRYPTIWWPPTVSLDAAGGVSGLVQGPLVGIPTFIPRHASTDTPPIAS